MPVDGRGDLPQTLLQGSSLLSLASAALSAAGCTLISRDMSWDAVRDLEVPVVLHDPLCPLLPAPVIASLIASVLPSALAGVVAGVVAGPTHAEVVVGTRPVTDTIKSRRVDRLGQTVSRELLVEIASPVVLPAAVVGALSQWPDTDSFATLVQSLRETFAVRFVEVPAVGRPVQDRSAVQLLGAFDELHRD